MNVVLKALLILSALLPFATHAQDYPTKLVTIVVPFTPGGSNDAVARFLADGLGKLWKQSIVVENRAGGGSSIGSAYVARSAPDGYRLLLVSSSYSANAATRDDQGFDPITALKPVSMVARSPVGILVGKRVPISSVADLAREAKKQTIFYATAGVGSIQHFTGEQVNGAMGIRMEAVPYRGGAEGFRDLVGGRVDVVVGGVAGMSASMEAGATLIAVLSKERSPSLPNVPTMNELGYPKALSENYWGLFVPAGTPPAIVAKIHAGVATLTHTPEGRAFLTKLNGEPTEMSSDDFTSYVKNEIAEWTKIAKDINVRPAKP